jgi:hypothetical protein
VKQTNFSIGFRIDSTDTSSLYEDCRNDRQELD